MTLYAIEWGPDDPYLIFNGEEDCLSYMMNRAHERLPRSTQIEYAELHRVADGSHEPLRWLTFKMKGPKVRKPTVEEAHQDELARMKYYNDMHMSAPCSGAVWVPPTRYEGY